MKDSIKSIMSKRLITLHPKDKIGRAEELFELFDIHHIPVVVMNRIVGIISQGDILFLTRKPVMHSFDQFIKEQRIELGTVDEIMTKNVITVEASSSINEVVEIFIKKRINAVPIIEHDRLIGLVTSYDLMNYLKMVVDNKNDFSRNHGKSLLL